MASRRDPKSTDRGNLPSALRLLRTRLNVPRIELADRISLHRQRLYNYEHGITEPSFAGLRTMLTGMGFDFHDLQDALDAVEDRPLRGRRPVAEPAEEQQESAPEFATSEAPLLLLFLRFFARMVAKEMKAVERN